MRLPLAEQRALAATVERLNATLAATPAEVGESRGGRFRVWIVSGVSYWHEVLPQEVRTIRFHARDAPESG